MRNLVSGLQNPAAKPGFFVSPGLPSQIMMRRTINPRRFAI